MLRLCKSRRAGVSSNTTCQNALTRLVRLANTTSPISCEPGNDLGGVRLEVLFDSFGERIPAIRQDRDSALRKLEPLNRPIMYEPGELLYGVLPLDLEAVTCTSEKRVGHVVGGSS